MLGTGTSFLQNIQKKNPIKKIYLLLFMCTLSLNDESIDFYKNMVHIFIFHKFVWRDVLMMWGTRTLTHNWWQLSGDWQLLGEQIPQRWREMKREVLNEAREGSTQSQKSKVDSFYQTLGTLEV